MMWPLRALVVTGIGLVTLAIWAQPRMADDWYLTWFLADAGSPGGFVADMYMGWSGRVLPFVLAGIFLSNDAAVHIFKLLTVPCFMLVAACAYYLATGSIPRLGRAFLLMAAVLWLGVPVASDTVVQLTGSAAYLWPAAAGLLMLCLFRQARDQALIGAARDGQWRARAGWLVAGIVIGTGNEQLFAGIAIVLAGWGWMLWRAGCLRNLAPQAWWGVAGLIVGALILIGAPGNYVRLGAQEGGGGIFSMLIRYAMYLGGAYFGLGTGDAGRALWLGISVIALSGVLTLSGDRGRETAIWLVASLATLAPMLPLVNFASPRTTFLAVIFLIIAAATAFPRKTGADTSAATLLVAYAMAMLVVIDGFVGWAANRSLAAEMTARLNIVQSAAAEGRKEVVVPDLATIPSRLTFMLNPVYDRAFVTNLARRSGLAVRHDEAAGAPQPHTLNSLKALKNSF